MWTAGLMCAVLGTRLPGPRSIYVSQQISFTRPVYFGDTITARAEVVERLVERRRVRLSTVYVNQRGEESWSVRPWSRLRKPWSPTQSGR